MRKWHPHFTRAPLAPITALAHAKCRDHARTGAQMVHLYKSMQPSIGITARPMALVYERSGKKSARARRMGYVQLDKPIPYEL